MKIRNIIKTLNSLGLEVEQIKTDNPAQTYRCKNNEHICQFWCYVDEDETDYVEVKKISDKNELYTDYYVGYFVKSIKQLKSIFTK